MRATSVTRPIVRCEAGQRGGAHKALGVPHVYETRLSEQRPERPGIRIGFISIYDT
jgi:hypothetical protein